MNYEICVGIIEIIMHDRLNSKHKEKETLSKVCSEIYSIFRHDGGYKTFDSSTKDTKEELQLLARFMRDTTFHITTNDFGNLAVVKIDKADII